ncbi:MAG: hypothetical protein GY721_00450 [Deltaproteobacteria bacterium]|nr:hypothetical protein [Deltaproteobacteria bacterium]
MGKDKEGRPPKTCTAKEQVSIADLGISRKQSSEYQQFANIPEDEVDARVEWRKPVERADRFI